MSLPRILEHLMAFLEDALFRKKKEEDQNNFDWFLHKNFLKGCMLKEKIFSEPIIQFVEEGERGQKFTERD